MNKLGIWKGEWSEQEWVEEEIVYCSGSSSVVMYSTVEGGSSSCNVCIIVVLYLLLLIPGGLCIVEWWGVDWYLQSEYCELGCWLVGHQMQQQTT